MTPRAPRATVPAGLYVVTIPEWDLEGREFVVQVEHDDRGVTLSIAANDAGPLPPWIERVQPYQIAWQRRIA